MPIFIFLDSVRNSTPYFSLSTFVRFQSFVSDYPEFCKVWFEKLVSDFEDRWKLNAQCLMFMLKEGLNPSQSDHHVVVCPLKLLRKQNRFYREKPIKSSLNHWLSKRYDLHLPTTLQSSSKNLRPPQTTLKLSGVCFK